MWYYIFLKFNILVYYVNFFLMPSMLLQHGIWLSDACEHMALKMILTYIKGNRGGQTGQEPRASRLSLRWVIEGVQSPVWSAEGKKACGKTRPISPSSHFWKMKLKKKGNAKRY